MSETNSSSSDIPAVAGGAPAKLGPYGKAERYGQEELAELKEALAQQTLFYAQGRKVRQLETEYAAYCGSRFAVATSSGTASIHSAMIASGVAPGDEVITSPITDMGTVIPILFQGATPVFADLDPRTYNLNPESVEAAITPRTRAVLAVHLAGNACDLTALDAICARHGLILIEDCAQAFGCRYEARPIGTRGSIGCFSLNEFKHISCGDGGIVVTDDPELADRLRLATDKGYNRRQGAAQRQPTFLANNYRMTELQGAVALAQLRKLDGIVARRRAWCGALREEIAGLGGLLPPTPTAGCAPSWWFFMMRVEPAVLGTDADGFAAALQAEGVPAGAHYIGQCVYEYPAFTERSFFAHGPQPGGERGYEHGLCPAAEAILDTCVILSVNEAYTEADRVATARAIRRTARWFSTR